MTWSILLAAAKPWTYWFAPILFITTILLTVAVAAGYYRRVAVPAFQWRVHEEQRRRAELRRRSGTVHRVPERSTPTPSAKAAA